MQLLKMHSFAEEFTGHPYDCGFNFQIDDARYSFEYIGETAMTALTTNFYTCLTTYKPYIL